MAVFGLVGAASYIGLAIQAAALAYRLINRPSRPAVEGPRLADLRAKASQMGLPIPIGWGRFRVTCSLLQASDKTEHLVEEEVGGKGAPTQTVRNYSYSSTAAWLLCDTEHTGPITRVNWLRLNGLTVYQYDGTTETVDTRIGSDWAIYLGTQAQAVDSDLEAIVGAGQQPAYRGLAYVRITDLDLSTWDNSLPLLVEAEVQGADPYLDDIVSDIFSAAGMDSDLADVSGLTIGYDDPCGYRAGTSEIVTRESLYSGPGLAGLTDPVNVFFVKDEWTEDGSTVSESSFLSTQAQVCGSNVKVYAPIFVVRCQYYPGFVTNAGILKSAAEEVLGVDFPCVQGPAAAKANIHSVMWGTIELTLDSSGLIPGFMRMGPFNFSASSEFMPYGWIAVVDGETTYFSPWIVQNSSGVSHRGKFDISTDADSATWWYNICGQDNTDKVFNGIYNSGGSDACDGLQIASSLFGQDTCCGTGGNIPALPNKTVTIHFGVAVPEGQNRLVTSGWYFGEEITLRSRLDGYTIPNQSRAMDALDELRAIEFLNVHHNGATLKVAPRSLSSVRTLDWLTDLMWLGDDQDPVETTTGDPVGQPDRILLRYPDVGAELETGSTLDAADLSDSGLVEQIDTNVSLTATAAAQVAERLWIDRASPGSITFGIGLQHSDLEADDVVTLTGTPYGEDILARITSAESDGAIVRVEAQIVYGDCSTYVSDATADERTDSATVRSMSDTIAYLLDLPLLLSTDDEDGVYVIGAPADSTGYWSGYTIYETRDGGMTWQALITQSAPGVIGEIDSLPGTTWYHSWDEGSELLVTLTRGTLDSKVDSALVSGGLNAAIIGNPIDGWEILQFGAAELVGANQWSLTHLLRARKGTDPEIAVPQVGDAFVLLNLGAARIPMAQSRIGQTITYRAVSAGQAIADVADQTMVYQGMAWRPYTVAQLEAVYDAVTDDGESYLVTWARRARKNISWSPGYSVPLDQTLERYRVRVYDGVTLESTQTIDDATTATVVVGSGDTRTIKVSQYGDVWGYGPEISISITN